MAAIYRVTVVAANALAQTQEFADSHHARLRYDAATKENSAYLFVVFGGQQLDSERPFVVLERWINPSLG